MFPYRCGVGYLGDEDRETETAVRGQVLINLVLGFCWLHGFQVAWIMDSVADIYSKEKVKYTMAAEGGQTFYERSGFQFSINTLHQRYQLQPCLGLSNWQPTTSSSSSNFVSGLCQLQRDLLPTPGFDPSVLYPLHEKAFNTFKALTFSCTDAVWANCNSSKNSSNGSSGNRDLYPLLIQLKDGRCAFEKERLWQELAQLSPSNCGKGQRVGACHRFVRHHLGCTDSKKTGCKYLQFLYAGFLYPGGDPQKKIPQQVQHHWDLIGKFLMEHNNLNPKELLLQLLHQELADCSSSSGSSRRPTLQQQMQRMPLTCEKLREDGKLLMQLLEESVLLLDLTGLPRFWVSAQHKDPAAAAAQGSSSTLRPANPYCPAAFAWEFITRMQGQMYRHRRLALPQAIRRTHIKVHHQQGRKHQQK